MNGKISQWKDDKGFGFIQPDDGSEKVFFHISSVKTNARRPQVGDTVVYEAMRDSQQRLKAKGVVIEDVAIAHRNSSVKNPTRTEKPTKNLFDFIAILVILFSISAIAVQFYRDSGLDNTWQFVLLAAVGFLVFNRQKKPREKSFNCSRCGTVANHDSRTITAWNNGFTKLYCKSCHAQWLREQPQQMHSSAQTKGNGCLGMMAIMVIAPVSFGVSVYQWFF